MKSAPVALALLCLAGCTGLPRDPKVYSFRDDVRFMKWHTDIVLLADPEGGGAIAVAPAYQGRVMTSASRPDDGPGYGWINRPLMTSGKFGPHMNAFGGEDRFWLGPEGGQFGIFFPPGAPFKADHWQTPPPIDTEPFEVVSTSSTRALFRRRAQFRNHSGTVFEADIERTVRLLNPLRVELLLEITLPPDVELVAFESHNRLANAGSEPWRRETGLLSIGILGMFQPSPGTTVVIPLRGGTEQTPGAPINETYVGKAPADRLMVSNNVAYFRGDGQYRSKIGIPPSRAWPLIGSYDERQHLLTLVQYTLSEDGEYVNSTWEPQEAPYTGDVVNAYNDGGELGPFYELGSASAARELAPGEAVEHTHRTFHFRGEEQLLDAIARETLGVSLDSIKAAF